MGNGFSAAACKDKALELVEEDEALLVQQQEQELEAAAAAAASTSMRRESLRPEDAIV